MKRYYAVRILAVFAFLGLVLYSSKAADAALHALQICAVSVIPSLFPFFAVSKILLSTGLSLAFMNRFSEKCFGVSGSCLSAFLISLLGGYPAGVSAIADLYQSGEISKQDAERSLCFCNNSGPAFFVGFIGSSILGSTRQGLALYLIHILSAILCGFLQYQPQQNHLQIRRIKANGKSLSGILPDAVSETCASLLQICGLIVFFAVLVTIIEEAGIFKILYLLPIRVPQAEIKALFCGMLELSSGVILTAGLPNAFVICAFLMGWGGLCVHMQASSILYNVGLRMNKYLYYKFLQSILSAILAFTYLSPSVFSVLTSISICLLSIIFPRFSEKWTGNPLKDTL